jgi:hypothetical protein
MTGTKRPGLFAGFGIELEYMIVDRDTLAVLPVCDELLLEATGSYRNSYEKEGICWSNELALHVVELKTCGPVGSLPPTLLLFHQDIKRINAMLVRYNGCLLPSAAHPWMDPHMEGRLWPHGDRQIYYAYDRIFDCRGHGWVNLQSCHLNLAFNGAKEFGRLHAATRLVLPLIPALAAASPILDGRYSGLRDFRMEYYRTNSRRIPSITGHIIPEQVFTPPGYKKEILERMYADIRQYDPDGILRHEWLNARGAIARFDRSALEIRVVDVQECPWADLAVAAAIIAAIKAQVAETWIDFRQQSAWEISPLKEILLETVRTAEEAVIRNPAYLEAFGISGIKAITAGELWRHLLATFPVEQELAPALEIILRHGTLASRILRGLGEGINRENLRHLYRELAVCLAENRLFLA